MKRKQIWPWIIAICSLLVILACVASATLGAAGIRAINQLSKGNQSESQVLSTKTSPDTAVLYNQQGWVEVQDDSGEWVPALPDQLLTIGQHIRTGKLSSASLLFHDGSQAVLKADTEISLDVLDAQPDGGQRVIVMTQITGESTHNVIPNKQTDSTYEVNSPSGNGVAKGTEFQVIVTPQQTAYFYVIEGVVEVSAQDTLVLVNSGYMTILYNNQPPLTPVETISVEGLVSQIGDPLVVASTTFAVNEATVTIGDPQIGDWVIVKGHLDENGQNIADWVIVLRPAVANRFSMTGTVESIETSQWIINGQTILVTETTILDEEIEVSDTVYVSGIVETAGVLKALQIERIDEETGTPFNFTGIVQKIEDGLWNISGVSVTLDEATVMTDGILAGDLVTVKGLIQSDGTWLAHRITLVTEENNVFTFTGKLESKDPWKVAGISFETQAETIIDENLNIGDLVRVEGIISADGIWIATKIERINPDNDTQMVLIGIVVTIDPWVVSGIPLILAPDAEIAENITVGMLVRVEMVLQADGTWLVIKIEPLNDLIWFPGCIDIIATVVSVDGNHLQLLNWLEVIIDEEAIIEGTLAPNSIIRMTICFDQDMVIRVTYIIIIQTDTDITEPPIGEDGGKVTICHKPGKKKGGNTLSISRSALPAHLGHGDYEGACR